MQPSGRESAGNHMPSHQLASCPRQTDVFYVNGIPSQYVRDGNLVIDDKNASLRSFTYIKTLGDGYFGTVTLCDWHGALPPNTAPPDMQRSRPEYAGKRLVAVKRMKRVWEGGWAECKKLKEIEFLRTIPAHPSLISFYDVFLSPETKELYMVFESMEGNLYQLIRARKGRPLAGELVASIFRQAVLGLHHMHSNGYFHRDLRPENILVTTTGLSNYRSLSPIAAPGTTERDIIVIIKLADFGLARKIASHPPYTEYVSCRWYRAPELLFEVRDHSTPIDIWALGVTMAELVNLRPLFPGTAVIDQLDKIYDVLGDPYHDHGVDSRGRPRGGGRWVWGVQFARRQWGYHHEKITPRGIETCFDPSVPLTLVDCISDLLRHDPAKRLTSQECLAHQYFVESNPDHTPLTLSLGSPHVDARPVQCGGKDDTTTRTPGPKKLILDLRVRDDLVNVAVEEKDSQLLVYGTFGSDIERLSRRQGHDYFAEFWYGLLYASASVFALVLFAITYALIML
ncbi:kinase-like protein [Coniophora puteana RWD-64-598 SS2]|uniref:Kinase-like protein n=1 Tax=Coniophora puteana (strain RWD-64-598) TaxID=741705 RepID=A0A5M3MH18_CONPW|nr:kinase-like protein [Coniophora puteana RWD-64-598 SS2]EIW77925.1 kinase-like protein [Coniophora puteana RWD-64-598 SS2]